jgi:DNA-directed RNA polymerase specialized sigma24 family protein
MADVLSIPEKTVKSRLFTARQQLKDILTEKGITR